MSKKVQTTTTNQTVSPATRARANSKLSYQTQYIQRLFESVKDFYADADEEAQAEAKSELQKLAQSLNAFLAE